MKIDELHNVLSKYIRDLDNIILLKWQGKWGCEITRVEISGMMFESIFLTLYMYNDYGSPIPFYVHRKDLRKFLKGEPMKDGTYLYGKGLTLVQELLAVDEPDLYDLHELHSKEDRRTIGQLVKAKNTLLQLCKDLNGVIDLTAKIAELEEKLQAEAAKYNALLKKECYYKPIFRERKRCTITEISHFTDQGYLVVKVEYPDIKGQDCACLYDLIFE